MNGYQELAAKVAEYQQVILSLAILGIGLAIALWIVWERYEKMHEFLKDDGLVGRFSLWRTKKERERARGDVCPTHGGLPLAYGQLCPRKGCLFVGGKKEDHK